MNIFFALYRSKLFLFLFVITAAGVMPCGSRKSFPALILSADYILVLVLLGQRMYSKNSKIVKCLDSFSKQIYDIWVIFRLISVFETTALLNLPINSIFLWLL